MTKILFLSDQRLLIAKSAIDYVIKKEGLINCKAGYLSAKQDLKREKFDFHKKLYQDLGLNLDLFLDLEKEFDETLFEKALTYPLLQMSGGNTYQLLFNLKRLKIEEKLKHYLLNGGIIVGTSASGIIQGHNIEPTALINDINEVGLTNLESLNNVDFLFLPHAIKTNEEQQNAKELTEKYNRDIYLCSDKDCLFFDNGIIIPFGNPLLIQKP